MSDFKETGIFPTGFKKIPKYQISKKIRPVGAELFQAEGQVGMTNLSRFFFRNFATAPKNMTALNTYTRAPVLKLYLEHHHEDLTVHKQVNVQGKRRQPSNFQNVPAVSAVMGESK